MNTNTIHTTTPNNDPKEAVKIKEGKLNPTDPGIKKRNPDTEVPEIGDDEVEPIEDQSKNETVTDNPAGSDKPTITNSPDMTEPNDTSSAPDTVII